MKATDVCRLPAVSTFPPINSPSKLTHSPAPKRLERARTFNEAVHLGQITEVALSNAGAL